MGEFFNLDSLVAEPKTVTLAGRAINVAKVPAVVVFRADELRDKLLHLQPGDSRAIVEGAAELIVIIARASGDPVDKDWLLENATVEQILDFVRVATLGKPEAEEPGKKKVDPEAGG